MKRTLFLSSAALMLTIMFQFCLLAEDGPSLQTIETGDNGFSEQIIKYNIPEPAAAALGIANEGEKFVFFDNLDPLFANAAYYVYFDQSLYKDDFTRAAFSDDFFANNSIADFDIAVFPTGSLVLYAETDGGIKIIDKINEMIDAGKKVMIFSRLGLKAQYGQYSNADVKDFLENTLGIEYIGWRPTSDTTGNTTTFRQFVAKGELDPVGSGFPKDCNVISSDVPPIAYYRNVDVFKSKDPNKYKAVDYLLSDRSALPSDTLLGIRAEPGEGKVVFWSFGLEVMCHPQDRNNLLMGAMRWLLREAPSPGPAIDFLSKLINFGSVEVGDTAAAVVVATNSGDSRLTISNIELEDFALGRFEFYGDFPTFPKYLLPDEMISLNVRFMPDEVASYNDFIDFTTDDGNGGSQITYVDLKGTGGVGTAPILSISETEVDFGEVEPLKPTYREVKFENTGTVEFFINYISFEENERTAFTFVEGSSVPITLEAGESSILRIKFVAQEADKEYRAKIKVLSNSRNLPQTYIELKGKGQPAGLVEEWASSADGRLKIKTTPNPADGVTQIHYRLGASIPERVEIIIVDAAGRQAASLVNATLAPGAYSAKFDASRAAAGAYMIIARAGGRYVSASLAVVK